MTWIVLLALAWGAGGAPAPAPAPTPAPPRDVAADLETPADALLRAARATTRIYGAHRATTVRIRRWPGPVLVRCRPDTARTEVEIGWLNDTFRDEVRTRVRIPRPDHDPRPRWERVIADGERSKFRARLRSSDAAATLRGRVRWRGTAPVAVPVVLTVPGDARVAPSDHPVLVERCRAGVQAEP